MQSKIITYKRILNLGNYESKHLEESAEVLEGEDVEEAISALMERVERKIREEVELILDARDLKTEIKYLDREIARLKDEKDKLTLVEEPDPDDIPFDPGDTPVSSSDIPDGF